MAGGQRRDRALAQDQLGASSRVGLDRRSDQADVGDPGADAASWPDVGRSRSAISTRGRAARKRWTIPGTIDSSAEPTKLTRRRPRRPASIPRAVAAAASSRPGSPGPRAGTPRRPAVSATRRRVRASSGTPSSASSAAICWRQRWLGDVQPRRRAAEVQLLGDGDEVSELAKLHDATASTAVPDKNRVWPLIAKQNQSILIRYWTGSTGAAYGPPAMSFLLTCPNCGVREVTDFGYGGEINPRPKSRPELPRAQRLQLLPPNIAGVQREWWFHRSGCRAWFYAERDTPTNEVLLKTPRRASP